MAAFGYAFLLVGALLIRQVVVGRAKELPGDMRDAAVAFLSADMDGLAEVFQRRGESVSVPVAATGTDTLSPATESTLTNDQPVAPFGDQSLSAEVMKLGKAARGYAWGATGPTYYDCSGLIWRAVRNLGIYNGPRFTTSTFRAVSKGWAYPVTSPSAGDIVLWEGDHIGVMVFPPDTLYSARNPSKGIASSSISGDSSFFGKQPTYWRVKK